MVVLLVVLGFLLNNEKDKVESQQKMIEERNTEVKSLKEVVISLENQESTKELIKNKEYEKTARTFIEEMINESQDVKESKSERVEPLMTAEAFEKYFTNNNEGLEEDTDSQLEEPSYVFESKASMISLFANVLNENEVELLSRFKQETIINDSVTANVMTFYTKMVKVKNEWKVDDYEHVATQAIE